MTTIFHQKKEEIQLSTTHLSVCCKAKVEIRKQWRRRFPGDTPKTTYKCTQCKKLCGVINI